MHYQTNLHCFEHYTPSRSKQDRVVESCIDFHDRILQTTWDECQDQQCRHGGYYHIQHVRELYHRVTTAMIAPSVTVEIGEIEEYKDDDPKCPFNAKMLVDLRNQGRWAFIAAIYMEVMTVTDENGDIQHMLEDVCVNFFVDAHSAADLKLLTEYVASQPLACKMNDIYLREPSEAEAA
jgi:hypothetical protein